MSAALHPPRDILSPNPRIGLYVHFPFCAYKCGYCDFNSWVEERAEPQRRWLDSLKKELLFWAQLNQGALSHFEVDTIFMGGGTPSLLRAELWSELSTFLKDKLVLSSQVEWTVEANPETLNEELLDVLEATGVNRISVGIQSFQEKYLKRLERGASPKANLDALELLSKKWKHRWSLDLMFGLPLQTLGEWKDDLTQALSFNPSHVSAYQLTLTTQKSKNWKQGTDSELLDFFRCTREVFSNSKLFPYEVSNFAIPGEECLHNLKYWRAEPFLGLGPGAYSLLPAQFFSDAPLGAHFKTPSRFDDWVNGCSGPDLNKAELRSEKEHLTELLMLGLRLENGIELSRFPRGVDLSFLAQYPDLIKVAGDRVAATEKGLEILDTTLLKITANI